MLAGNAALFGCCTRRGSYERWKAVEILLVLEHDCMILLVSEHMLAEFRAQGGEPLVAFDVVKRIVDRAREKNRTAGKRLEFTMVSNLSLMDEEKLAWLVENKVQLCTSIDGPEHLHDKQRKLVVRGDDGKPAAASAHAEAARWIRRINDAYVKMGLDPTLYHVEALLTTTREALPRWKEIVDTYVDLGCRALFLRPVDPFGFADRTAPRVEYPRAGLRVRRVWQDVNGQWQPRDLTGERIAPR